jgi:hypothetical protein
MPWERRTIRTASCVAREKRQGKARGLNTSGVIYFASKSYAITQTPKGIRLQMDSRCTARVARHDRRATRAPPMHTAMFKDAPQTY